MSIPTEILDQLKRDLEWCLFALAAIKSGKPIPPRQPPTPPIRPSDPTKPPTPTPQPRAVLNPSAPYDWSTPQAARHSCRVIADEEGLTVEQKNLMSQTLHCESGYNNKATHPNLNTKGFVTSTDYGIAQINDHWHIGEGKTFPSVEYVKENPEKVIRWMCKMVKAGKLNLWVCYSSKLYLKYTA